MRKAALPTGQVRTPAARPALPGAKAKDGSSSWVSDMYQAAHGIEAYPKPGKPPKMTGGAR